MTTQTQEQGFQEKLGNILETILRGDWGFSDCYDASMELSKKGRVIFGNKEAGSEKDRHQEFFSKFPFINYTKKIGFDVSEASIEWDRFISSEELQKYVVEQKKKFEEKIDTITNERDEKESKYERALENNIEEIVNKRKELELAIAHDVAACKSVLSEMWEKERRHKINQNMYIVLLQLLAKDELYFVNQNAGSNICDEFKEFFDKYPIVEYKSKVGPQASYAKIVWEEPDCLVKSIEFETYVEYQRAKYDEKEVELKTYYANKQAEAKEEYQGNLNRITIEVTRLSNVINSVGLDYAKM